MSEVQIDHNDDSRKWIVEFTDLRVQNEHQRRVAESLDCEFACNTDPLRGVFASNSDPL